MKKILWSISTTVRNPERLIDFLRVLKQLEGVNFDKNTQMKYQILLIKERIYTPTKIPTKYRDLFYDIRRDLPYEVAEEIFFYQNYKDPPMRGRQSVNPLNKLGFSIAKEAFGPVIITELGNLFISAKADISSIFLKSLLKLQFPNPLSVDFSEKKGFNVRPFVATLHLIKKVKGLSQIEFSLFVPTLIDYQDIDKYAEYILEFRKLKSSKRKETFIRNFLKSFYEVDVLSEKQMNNPFEYGDNSMRYFRLTKYFRVERYPLGRWRIDLEPTRREEIDQLLSKYDGSALNFPNAESYLDYLSDINKPELPWEISIDKYRNIIKSLINVIRDDFERLDLSLQESLKPTYEAFIEMNLDKLSLPQLEEVTKELRSFRLKIIHLSRDKVLRKNIDELGKIVNILKDRRIIKKLDPVEFEFLIFQCLKILNDEIEIRANCILDDEGNPIGFAPGNKPDIEGYYATFNSIFEATLDVSRHQVYRESIPVMRHLKDFANSNVGKPAFCIFVASKVHNDTINYFWYSVKYGFEGEKQYIVALELEHFIKILKIFIVTVKNGRSFAHKQLKVLFDSIIKAANNKNSSIEWFKEVSLCIERWEKSLM
ncbi:MAG: hypothetical protein DRP84_08480 [Spirochaetes bacterium]|nr:MAG: hypothetical protein DRP84_08480 [Spirochaetota bacterium]